MDTKTFLKRTGDNIVPSSVAEETSAPPPVTEVVGPADEQSATDSPSGVVEVTLPSGIQVYFQSAPKRLYRIREKKGEWVEVPSITEVTKILDKPGLVHWGEKVGINMVQSLLQQGAVDPDFVRKNVQTEAKDPPWFNGAHLQEIGKQKHLTNYHMKDVASSRGVSVHQALEGWAMSGNLSDPDVFPEEEQGYVRGLNKFLSESKISPTMSEVIVASTLHGIAGRFDLVGVIPAPVKLCVHLTPKNEKYKEIETGSFLIDLKTSKGVYDDHHVQVAAYKGIMVESGYDEPDSGYILRVSRDGRYEFVRAQAEWLDFWYLRGLYDGLQRIKEQSRTEYR